jgi:hypothetical protein
MRAVHIVLTASLVFAMPVFAGDARVQEMERLAREGGADKKAIVVQALELSSAQSGRFWPLYDDYQKELALIDGRLATLVVTYADAWHQGPVSDITARKLTMEMLAIEDAESKLKRAFLPRLKKVLPAAKVARYLLIETKIRADIRHEIASRIPLGK